MSTRTIEVVRAEQVLSFINSQNVEEVLGEIVIDRYGQDEVKRFLFKPEPTNPFTVQYKKDSVYKLGVGSAHLRFVNPVDVQRKILDQGWVIQDQYARRGGLELETYFAHHDFEMPDFFEYDNEFWSWRKQPEEGKIFAGLSLRTDLRLGHMAVRIRQGFYRLICANGIFSSLLNLPEINIRHVDWDVHKLELEDSLLGPDNLGPELTNTRFLSYARNLIGRYHREANNGGLSDQMQLLEQQFTGLSQNTLKPWAIEGYLTQLDIILDKFSADDPVRGIHLVNAYTNAVNSYRMRQSDRGIFSALDGTDAIVRATVSLANIASIFS